MATGGQTSDSVPGSSVTKHEFSCTPCSDEGKNMQAVNFCENCELYFCAICIGHHSKLFKFHRLLDKAAIKSGSAQKTKPKSTSMDLTEECKEHPGNIIQMFCGTHDLVCCTVCIAIDHRACNDVDFIPKAAKAFFNEQDKNETEILLDSLCKEINQLKETKSGELINLNTKKRDILQKIQTTKERLLARINELERSSVANVMEIFTNTSDLVQAELEQLDEQLLETKHHKQSMTKTKDSNEAQMFVKLKQSNNVIEKTKTLLTELKSLPREISFVFDEKLESVFSTSMSLGSASVSGQFYSASLIGEYGGTGACFGMCTLDNGDILMTDYYNNQLQKIGKKYQVKDNCSINYPFSVCRISSSEVAVSLLDGGKVCFVNIADKMTVKRTVSVGGHCMGIAFSKEELFVACGNYNGNTNNRINVYNLEGSHLRSIKQTTHLAHLAVTPDGSKIYVACKNDGLIIVDRTGNRVPLPFYTSLKSVHGICLDDYGNTYICSEKESKVIQIDRNGSVSEILTQKSDGIFQPLSVTIATNPLRMIVTSRSKAIQVFKLQ